MISKCELVRQAWQTRGLRQVTAHRYEADMGNATISSTVSMSDGVAVSSLIAWYSK